MKPIFAASASRVSTACTARTSPARPTSPKITHDESTGRSSQELTSAAEIARSAAGSVSSTPPATFTKRSHGPNETPCLRSSTAASSATRFGSTPMHLRWPVPYDVGATSACTSTSSGRVPLTVAVTTEPACPSGRSARKSADGSDTSASPLPFISKTPSSLVLPNRFLCARRTRKACVASPSK